MEHVARFDNRRRIDRDVSFVNVSNDSFFIDQEGGAISEALLLVKDSIIFDDGTLEIAEEWKGDSDLLCKFAVGGNAVNT